MTNTSKQRITRFVDWFIRSKYMRNFGDTSDDWINDSNRMQRCEDAAENGSDGSTHEEHIQDMRESFSDWFRYIRRSNECELFVDGVNAHFDALEQWHETNGSLNEEVG